MARSMTFDAGNISVQKMTLDDLRKKSDFFPLQDMADEKPATREIVQVPLEIYVALFLPFLLGFILTS